MAKVQAETCSTHVKEHFLIKINLCCVGMNVDYGNVGLHRTVIRWKN